MTPSPNALDSQTVAWPDARRMTSPFVPGVAGTLVGTLIESATQVAADVLVRDVKRILARRGPVAAIAVVEDQAPVGLIMSIHLDRILSQRYGVSLFERRPVWEVMDDAPLVVDSLTPLETVAGQAMSRDPTKIYDHILVADGGRFSGLVSVQKILLALVAQEENQTRELQRSNHRLRHEIQERQEAERQLRQHARIVSVSRDMMAVVDKNYVYQTVNDAFLNITGRSREDIVGNTVPDILGKKLFYNKLKPHIDRCLTGEVVRFQTTSRFPDLGERHMDVAYYPYREDNGEVAGYVINARDVSEFRDLENALKHSQKMEAVGTLAGGIAHDFNNILAAVLGYAQLAQLEGHESDLTSHALEQIVKASLRAKDLVTQILAFSRKIEPEKRLISICEVVDEVLKLLRASLPTSITIDFTPRSEACTVNADPSQIHQVLMNLCTNAAHAMEAEGGVLSIDVSHKTVGKTASRRLKNLRPGNYVVISVQDTGSGISPEVIDKIFDPYFTTKSQDKGSGMGLAVVHGIVRHHGGGIDLCSIPGNGTTFDVLLPQVVTADRCQPTVKAFDPSGHERILLVDDEHVLLDLGKSILERLGYRVDTFTDPVAAVDAFMRNPEVYDLIITDMTMPGLNGEQLVAQIRKIRPGMKIILCSGYSKDVALSTQQLLRQGIHRYVMKPFTIASLSNSVREVLDAR